jgi:hypothetical protein
MTACWYLKYRKLDKKGCEHYKSRAAQDRGRNAFFYNLPTRTFHEPRRLRPQGVGP